MLVAFIGYLNSFFDPLQQLSQLYNTFQASMAAVQKIYKVLDTDPDMLDAPGAVDLPDVHGAVELRDVTFGYDPDKPVLHDVDLRHPGGEDRRARRRHRRRQVDGHQAARPLLRSAGRARCSSTVTTCARSRSAPCASSWPSCRRRRSSSAAPCSTTSASPARRASDDEVKRVARIVGVHDFVEGLPDGYDTEVQEGGSALSTGQRQLISFARALLADPRILILDEATSSVDAESERRIERAMEVLFSGRTSIIVAHRLSTVRYADEIVVVDGGRIVERGTHDELVAAGGRYAGPVPRLGSDRPGALSVRPARRRPAAPEGGQVTGASRSFMHVNPPGTQRR